MLQLGFNVLLFTLRTNSTDFETRGTSPGDAARSILTERR